MQTMMGSAKPGHLSLAARGDAAAAQPLKQDTDGTADAEEGSDEEIAELHELLQQMRDPAIRYNRFAAAVCI